MKVYEVMTPEVVSVSADTSVQDATSFMRWQAIGPLSVCEGGRILGMLPGLEIAARAAGCGGDPVTTPVSQVMIPEYCFGTDEVESAARTMEAAHVRGLVVVDEDLRPVGVVSKRDLPRAAVAPLPGRSSATRQ